jgi:ankyrin repeat protein
MVFSNSICSIDPMPFNKTLTSDIGFNQKAFQKLLDSFAPNYAEGVRLFIKLGVNINSKDNITGWTPLIGACIALKNEESLKDMMQLLIEAGADVNIKDEEGRTALMEACSCGDGCKEVVRLLIEAGADVNATDKEGWSALRMACYYIESETTLNMVVQDFIDAGVDVNAKDNEGCTVLIETCARERKSAVKGVIQKLIEAGANVNQTDSCGFTALMAACLFIHDEKILQEIVQFLVDKGAKVNAKDVYGFTALLYACTPKNNINVLKGIFQVLVTAGADIDVQTINNYGEILSPIGVIEANKELTRDQKKAIKKILKSAKQQSFFGTLWPWGK